MIEVKLSWLPSWPAQRKKVGLNSKKPAKNEIAKIRKIDWL
jgi:hypothetical protein